MSIQLTVVLSGLGPRPLTGKADGDGLTVALENEASCFVSWTAFKQLLSFTAVQAGKPDGNAVEPLPAAHQQ